MLTRAEIKGFKCLHDVSVELGPFNVLIGPNDSGKSSFLQALGEPQKMDHRRRAALRQRYWGVAAELGVASGRTTNDVH